VERCYVSAVIPAGAVHGLRDEVEGQQWYHTLELAPGIVTPGWFDSRPVASRLPIPASLEGKRCLDIGTFEGFWAFEMERRGGAEVIATDLIDPYQWDWPAGSPPEAIEGLAQRMRGGTGFELARQALGSRVERRILSIYDLDPADVGMFDFVFLGSLLLQLRDPIGALERVRRVTAGQLLVMDVYDPLFTLLFPRRPMARLDANDRPWWWQSNIACLVRMAEAAGFALETRPQRILMPPGRGMPVPRLGPRTLVRREHRQNFRNARRGDPHVALLLRPRG
jgi:tRNA (mo5U34)-methyltransferase